MAGDAVREAADRLAGYAVTCRMDNTLEWMEGMAVRLNEYLKAVGDSQRVQTSGNGLELFYEKRRP